jgi:hypothetical protein
MATRSVLRPPVQVPDSLRSPVQVAVYRALVSMLGAKNSAAVDFYVDTRLVTDDPERYEQAIRLLLGEHWGSLVIQGIKSELSAADHGQVSPKESLASMVGKYERTLARRSRIER